MKIMNIDINYLLRLTEQNLIYNQLLFADIFLFKLIFIVLMNVKRNKYPILNDSFAKQLLWNNIFLIQKQSNTFPNVSSI